MDHEEKKAPTDVTAKREALEKLKAAPKMPTLAEQGLYPGIGSPADQTGGRR